ncbi:MAG: cellulase family glycosylhydrolase [Spirochaetes bacterium]|nr:cellulase family glycosylhydrolase [Spirochaetota bacterium]
MRRPFFITLVLCTFLLASGADSPGLSIVNGTLMRGGKPYRAMGINYFSAFYRAVLAPTNTSYRDGFAVLARYNIPFVRFAACPFWPTDWKLYQTDKARYFAILDDVIATASSNHIGVIPSLFWNFPSAADICGEPLSAWGDTSSKTHAFMRTYTTEVMTRYRSNPAVWAWEFGNEFNLGVDLPNAKKSLTDKKAMPRQGVPARTEADILTSDIMITALSEFGKLARTLDANRLIMSGNSRPRPSAWNNSAKGSWTTDTREEYQKVLIRDNPDPLNGISIHYYEGKDKYFSQDNPASMPEVLAATMEAAAQVNKALLVGEFGANKKLGPSEERALFEKMIDAIVNGNIPLSAVWVFDLPNQNDEWNITEKNERAYMLTFITNANAAIMNR